MSTRSTRTTTTSTTRIQVRLSADELTALRAHPEYTASPGMRGGDSGMIHLLLMRALGRESVDRHRLTKKQKQDEATVARLRREGWVK